MNRMKSILDLLGTHCFRSSTATAAEDCLIKKGQSVVREANQTQSVTDINMM